MKWGLLALAALPLAAAGLAKEDDALHADLTRNGRTPRVNYMIECQGCHLSDGSGMPGKVPVLKGEISRFLSVEGGRQFIVRVPGVTNAKLSDADLADVMNWLILTMDKPAAADGFVPYTAKEIAANRNLRLQDVAPVRSELVSRFRPR